MEKLFSFDELEKHTGIRVVTWRAWASRRMFPVVRLGRRVKVRESDFQRFIEARVTPARPERDAR